MHTPVSLTPMNIHTLTVRNRFVLPGMVTDMAVDGGYVTERLLSYYEERAKGGVGLVIVEATSIDVSGKTFLHGWTSAMTVSSPACACSRNASTPTGPPSPSSSSTAGAARIPNIPTCPAGSWASFRACLSRQRHHP